MAESNPPATEPVTPNKQQTFVSNTNTPLSKAELKTGRLTRLLKEEMLDSTADNTKGLLNIAFPQASLSMSIDDAVKLLVKGGLLFHDPQDQSRLVWMANIKALTTYNEPGVIRPEDCLKDFLNGIGTALHNSGSVDHKFRRWSTAIATAVALPGGPAKRKPDLVLTSELEGETASWENIHSTLQLKYKDSPRLCGKNAEQLSSDAFMTFSSQNTRRFFLGISFCGYTVRIYAFNRAGRVSSEPFDIYDDPRALVHLLIGLTVSPANLLGLDASYIWTGHHFSRRVNGVFYQLLKCVFRSKTIRERGTACWCAIEDANSDGREYAIKDAWTDMSRTQEAELMEKLKGIEGISTLVGSERLDHADGRDVTGYFRRNVEETKTEGKENDQKGHVEIRRHWVLVICPFAQPLASFSSKKELLSALVDIIKAHKAMLTRNILHRNIGLDNVMIYNPRKAHRAHDKKQRKNEPTAPKKGLLIDLDYSIELPHGSSDRPMAVGHRTGTLPFMAIDVLEGKLLHHGSHHDLESIFYVFVWICIFYRGPNDSPRFRALDNTTQYWTGLMKFKVAIIALTKSAIFQNEDNFDEYIEENAAKYFHNLIPCLKELRSIFFNKTSPATHDNMVSIFESHMKELPDVDSWVDDEMPVPTKKHLCNDKEPF